MARRGQFPSGMDTQTTSVRPQHALGGLAGGSLATGLPWDHLATIIGAAIDSGTLTLSVTAVANHLVSAAALTQLLSGVLVLGTLYLYVDDIYLDRARFVTARRGFRTLTAGVSAAFAMLFADSLRLVAPPTDTGRWAGAVVLISFAGTALFTLYFLHGDLALYDPEGELVRLMARFVGGSPADLFEGLEAATGLWRRVLVGVHLALVGLVFVLPCILFGLGAATLVALYPLPELSVLAGVAVSAGDRAPPVGFPVPSGTYDLEQVLYDPLDDATRNLKGIFLTLFCLLNASLFAVAGGFGVDAVGAMADSPDVGFADASPDQIVAGVSELLVTVLVVSGLLVALLVGSLYSVVFWIQELCRLPAYTRHWECRRRDGAVETPPPTAVRAFPLFFAGMVLLLLVAVYIGSDPVLSRPGDPGNVLLVLVWPLLAVLSVVLAWLTFQTDPQRVDRESHVIAVAAAIELVVSFAFGAVEGVGAEQAFVLLDLLAGVAVVVWLPELILWSERREGDSEPLLAALFVGTFALFLALTAWQFPDALPVFGPLTTLCVLLILVSEGREWLSSHPG